MEAGARRPIEWGNQAERGYPRRKREVWRTGKSWIRHKRSLADIVSLILLASSASERIASFAGTAKRTTRTTARAGSFLPVPILIFFVLAGVLSRRNLACAYYVIEITGHFLAKISRSAVG
jgi:hypothetical protein